MHDREEQYPLHQPSRDKQHHPFDDDTVIDRSSNKGDNISDVEEAQHQHKPVHQREVASTPELPKGRFLNSVIIGAVIGILASIVNIVITVINAATFQALSDSSPTGPHPNSVNYSALSFKVVGLGALIFVVSIALYFLGGLIIGRVAVHRRLGFLGGFVAGLVYYLIASFLVRYIPNYPGNLAATSGSPFETTAGIVILIIVFLLWGAIGGGMSLLGAWLVTRRHPYYVGYSG